MPVVTASATLTGTGGLAGIGVPTIVPAPGQISGTTVLGGAGALTLTAAAAAAVSNARAVFRAAPRLSMFRAIGTDTMYDQITVTPTDTPFLGSKDVAALYWSDYSTLCAGGDGITSVTGEVKEIASPYTGIPVADVTSTVLISTTIINAALSTPTTIAPATAGSSTATGVACTLGNANAKPGYTYRVTLTLTMTSGKKYERKWPLLLCPTEP